MSRHAEHRACPLCGGRLDSVSEVREIRIGRRCARVEDRFQRCTQCAEELYAPGQMAATQRRAADLIRAEEGLLLPREIREIRQQLGLTQQGLERLLGVGPKTVVRWERGSVFQNRSTDALLRVLREFPEASGFLAERHGVALRS